MRYMPGRRSKRQMGEAGSNPAPCNVVNAQAANGRLLIMGILYRLTFPNGKVYIGITTESLGRRVQRHIAYARSNRPYALSAAIRKYGEESFAAEVIGMANAWGELVKLEIDAIREHGSLCPNGYNMTAGGEGSLHVTPTEEKRAKISQTLSGRKLSEAHRKAVGDAQRGKTIPIQTRMRMREAHKSRPSMSLEQRAIRSEAAKRQHAARRARLTTNQPEH